MAYSPSRGGQSPTIGQALQATLNNDTGTGAVMMRTLGQAWRGSRRADCYHTDDEVPRFNGNNDRTGAVKLGVLTKQEGTIADDRTGTACDAESPTRVQAL
jgi:hypothetical protein